MKKISFKKNDFVTCLGEGNTVYRVAEVCEDGFCSLMYLNWRGNELYHGAESPNKLTKIKKPVIVTKSFSWEVD